MRRACSSICGIEQCPRALGADDRRSGDGRRQRPALREELGGPHLDAIDDRDCRERRARPDRGIDAIDGDERVGVRRAQIDDEVGLVGQAVAGDGVRILRRRLRERGYSDDAQTASPRAPRHLDRERRSCRRPRTRSSRPVVRIEKLDRMTSARPDMRSMAIAWRWPFAPTTWVWNVIDSSTIGFEPGIRAVAREHLLDGDARVAGPETGGQARRSRSPRHTTGWPAPSRSAWVSASGSRTGRASSSQASTGTASRRSSVAPRRCRRPRRRSRWWPSPRLARPEVVDDRLGRRRADARRAERHHLEQRVERADATGGLDLDMWRDVWHASGAGRRGSRRPARSPSTS